MILEEFIENLNEVNTQNEVQNNKDITTQIYRIAKLLDLPSEALNAIQEALETISENPNMKVALNQLKTQLIHNYESAEAVLKLWKTVEVDESIKDMIIACAVISSVDYTLEYYKENQIDKSILWATFKDIKIWMVDCKNEFGWWGLREVSWLLNHIHHRLYCLGRLQFMPTKVDLPYLLLENRKTKCYKLVIKGDIDCTVDGYVVQKCVGDLSVEFRTVCQKNDYFIFAHEVVDGVISKEQKHFELNKWKVALDFENIMVLDIHIPAGEKLSIKACEESLGTAKQFFESKRSKAFICQSWLLDKNLQDILNPSSNILKFQELFCLAPPIKMEFKQPLERIFGKDVAIEDISPQNSLQQGALEYIRYGKILRQGIGIIAIEESL